MIERTALEIADSLEVEMLSLKNADAAAEMLRSQAAEIERLTSCLFEMQNAAKSLAAERHFAVEDFLTRTGQYVTNDASREAAIAAAVAAERETARMAWNKRADQSKALAALRAFAQAVMDCWPDGWGIEGDDLQRIATEHGMLRPEIRNEPCGDGCRCADLVLPAEWNDGVVCYRKTALLTGADK